MILPVYVYGSPILRKVAAEIDKDYPGLEQFINDLTETMYFTDGVGLAAPQVGKSIKVLSIDATPFKDDDPSLEDFKRVMINPKIIVRTGDETPFNEGCISIPGIRENVLRPTRIKVTYFDPEFNFKEETIEGIAARIVQHECDHLEGVLFIDHISMMRKKLLKRKLTDISKGDVDVDYKIVFPVKK